MGNLVLIFTSIVMGAVGQILLKVGANELGGFKISFSGLLSLLKNYHILIGILLFGASFLLWVKVLTNNELSFVYPLLSVSYIIILFASHFLFNEPFTMNKIIGVIAIITGVFFINR